jgi:hypothetical protein
MWQEEEGPSRFICEEPFYSSVRRYCSSNQPIIYVFPIGLLKLASYHRLCEDSVELLRECVKPKRKPRFGFLKRAYTQAGRTVGQQSVSIKNMFSTADVWLGEVYAS